VAKNEVRVGRSKADSVASLHADVGRATRRLSVVHAARLHCEKGCSGCCVDDLTVFEVEAQNIRRHHASLLAAGVPHVVGACAFLDPDGACRIYAERPYVCRTQGLPLRWIEERDGGAVELRDICPLNEAGGAIEELEADACWSVGPIEERLARLELAVGPAAERVRLRDLFARAGGDGDATRRPPEAPR
jgi:Fe-S-cluster containining protein